MKNFIARGGKMSQETLELTIDKFTFRVPGDFYFNEAGVWARPEGVRARVGLSDFAQQRSGDIAFAEIPPVGTALQPGDELASIETIKVNVILPSPVTGTIVEVNPALEMEPERVNEDPYGEGWLAVVQLSDWETDKARLLDAQAYYVLMQEQVEDELNA
jgi:glycine cleavage system H protein